MNKALYFVAGAILGAFGGYFVARHMYKGRAEEEIVQLTEKIAELEKSLADTDKNVSEMVQSYFGFTEPYSNTDGEYPLDDDDEGDEEDDYELDDKVVQYYNPDADGPHIIDYDQFNDEDYDGYTKIGMTYYSDHILIEDGGERIHSKHAAGLLGLGFDKFDEAFGEEDTFYIRDDSKSTDYEVIRVEEPYLKEDFDEYYDK